MATIMISVGDIGELIEAFSAAAFVFYMLVFISVFIMRVTHRDQPRLFKVHLYYTLYMYKIITYSYQCTSICGIILIIQPCTCDFALIVLLSVSLPLSPPLSHYLHSGVLHHPHCRICYPLFSVSRRSSNPSKASANAACSQRHVHWNPFLHLSCHGDALETKTSISR